MKMKRNILINIAFFCFPFAKYLSLFLYIFIGTYLHYVGAPKILDIFIFAVNNLPACLSCVAVVSFCCIKLFPAFQAWFHVRENARPHVNLTGIYYCFSLSKILSAQLITFHFEFWEYCYHFATFRFIQTKNTFVLSQLFKYIRFICCTMVYGSVIMVLLHASHNELLIHYIKRCGNRTTIASWGSLQCRIISQMIYSYQDDLPIFLWKFWQQQFANAINFFVSIIHYYA